MLSRLPIEVLLIIIRFVPWLDRYRLRAVSYEWRALIDGPPGDLAPKEDGDDTGPSPILLRWASRHGDVAR